MKRLVFILSSVALLLFSCEGNRQKGGLDDVQKDTVQVVEQETAIDEDSMEQFVTEGPMPRAADELFDDFLFNFAASRKLQMERVAFPLHLTRNGKTELIEHGQWKMDHFFMHQGYYTQMFDRESDQELTKDTSVNQAIVEKIYFNTGAVQQYRFRRVNGAWMLMAIHTEPIDVNTNASFLKFYHKFVTDTTFQMKSLSNEVLFVGPDPDDDFGRMEGLITPDTWLAFAPELPVRMIYNIIYGVPSKPSDQKIFIMRGIANGLELEMTFKYTDGHWLLTKLTT